MSSTTTQKYSISVYQDSEMHLRCLIRIYQSCHPFAFTEPITYRCVAHGISLIYTQLFFIPGEPIKSMRNTILSELIRFTSGSGKFRYHSWF